MEIDGVIKQYIENEELNKYLNVCTKKIELSPNIKPEITLNNYVKCMDKIFSFMKFVNEDKTI